MVDRCTFDKFADDPIYKGDRRREAYNELSNVDEKLETTVLRM